MTRRFSLMLVALLAASSPALPQEHVPSLPDTLDEEESLGDAAEREESPLGELIASAAKPQTPFLALRSRFAQRTATPEGYRDGSYAGSPLKSYQRMKVFPWPGMSGGVLIEKDAGERRLDDFLAWNAVLESGGVVQRVIVGDYLVESGQGLLLWRGVEAGKGAQISEPVARKARGAVPYLSSGEDAFFRGAAVVLAAGRYSATAFASRRLHDARLEAGAAAGLSSGGYFRTQAEEARRGNLSERLAGVTMQLQCGTSGAFGFRWYVSTLSRTLKLDGGRRFEGERIAAASADYRLGLGPWTLLGEWGAANGAIAGRSGVVLRLSAGLEMAASFHASEYRFVSLHGHGVGGESGSSNDEGIYAAVRYVPHRMLMLSAYAELRRSPAGGAGRFLSEGSERSLQADVRPADRCRIVLRYLSREDAGDEPFDVANGLQAWRLRTALRRSFRMTIDYKTPAGVRSRLRAEFVRSGAAEEGGPQERGAFLLQEFSGAFSGPLRWNLRAAFFRTSSYDARVVAYEPDLEGLTSLPALYGEGLRWSFVLRWHASEGLVLSGKYAVTVRDDVRRIGSGPERLPGRSDGRVSLQMDLER